MNIVRSYDSELLNAKTANVNQLKRDFLVK